MNAYGVNLPRWGLKPIKNLSLTEVLNRVNLPRWGLKRVSELDDKPNFVCKFTPLGFETDL